MDWKAVASLAAPFAPTIGKILGGLIPVPGGALLGEWAGSALAKALGVPATPEAVGGALQSLPADEAAAKLSAVEGEAASKWEAWARVEEAQAQDRTAQSQAINETVRAEVAAGVSWYHWRHLLGYVPVVIGAEVAVLLPLVALGKISATDMATLLSAITPIMTIVSALLGYVAQDTTKLKTVAITGEQAPSITDNVVSAVKKAVGKAPAATVTIGKPAGARD